jgi:hypothetical protein
MALKTELLVATEVLEAVLVGIRHLVLVLVKVIHLQLPHLKAITGAQALEPVGVVRLVVVALAQLVAQEFLLE